MSATTAGERLQKVLARLGFGSRREIESWIRAGRIAVNGRPAELGQRVGADDRISLDGRPLRRREPRAAQVFVCHRSPGESLREGDATAEEVAVEVGDQPRSTIVERMPTTAGRRFIAVSPMPRVDGGLELLTSDGELALRLQRAVRGLPTGFSVRIHGELSEAQIAGVLTGELDSGRRLVVESCESGGGEASNRWYEVALTGASGREVRQLFERQGALVGRVLRIRLGPLRLERSLPRGQYRALGTKEIAALDPGAVTGEITEAAKPPAGSASRPAAKPRAPSRVRPSVPGSRKSGPSRRGSPDRAGRGKRR